MSDPAKQPADQLQVARRRALGPYLARLREWTAAHQIVVDREMPVRVEIGEQHLILDAWAGEQLRHHFDGSGGAHSDCPNLLVQVVALLAKSADDVQRLSDVQGSPTEVFYAQQAELMLDVTLGAAVLEETQRILDGMLLLERADEAQHLGKVFHRLRHSVDMVSATLERSERRRSESPAAEAEAEATTVRPPGPPADEIVLDAGEPFEADPDDVAQTTRPRETRAPFAEQATYPPRRSASWSRTRSLLLALALILVARGVYVELPRLTDRAPQALTAELQGHGELVQSVTLLPPSLYVDVDEAAWRAAGKGERSRLVEEMVRAAATHDCKGVLLRATTGRPLAQWWASRGVALYPDGSGSGVRHATESQPAR